MDQFDVVIVGGGAAGFFSAINLAEMRPGLRIVILEQSKEALSKVRISGGGRCNVTHACFDPKTLTEYYPRGQKELLGPFHKFDCGSTMAWFEERGVALKIEDDGRVFPTSDDSASIVNCLLKRAKHLNVEVRYHSKVKNFHPYGNGWKIEISETIINANHLVITTGSSPFIWNILKTLGHSIVDAVPSLFTFHCTDARIKGLQGLSLPYVTLNVLGSTIETDGPILITHTGLSGPAVLKASAWGALLLSKNKYHFNIVIDWMPGVSEEEISSLKPSMGTKSVFSNALYNVPTRLWKSLVLSSNIVESTRWADMNKDQSLALIQNLKNCSLEIYGKSTFKEEFVTAGGVDLKEIDFKNFKSKLMPNLYLAGEVINVDAVTGGFNFQAAWTGGYLIALGIAQSQY